jgi:hypothetical protein
MSTIYDIPAAEVLLTQVPPKLYKPGDLTKNATVLTGTSGVATVDVANLAASTPEPEYGVLEYAGWFKYLSQTAGTLTFQVTGPAGWQGVVEVYREVAGLVLLGAAPPGGVLKIQLAAGETVLARVHPYSVDDAAIAELTWSYAANVYSAAFGGDGVLSVQAVAHKQVSTPVQFSGEGTLIADTKQRPIKRWKFTDRHESESWTMPVNPNTMTSPWEVKNMVYAHGERIGLERIRAVQLPSEIVRWEFGGVIYTKEHHDELLRWTKKQHEVQVSDHLGRTFEVVLQNYAPEDRTVKQWPEGASLSHWRRWRMRYTMTALILRRVS